MTKPAKRPRDVAPGGMSGSGRMHDPSEAEHDRRRRLLMNLAFGGIAVVTALQWYWLGVRGGEWLLVAMLIVAAVPAGLAAKVFELRFKMACEERRRMLREIPTGKQVEFLVYAGLVCVVFALAGALTPWALWGFWFYDFVTYYHNRPERMRHMYAVALTLDELRDFRVPWAWTLPALAWEILRHRFW